MRCNADEGRAGVREKARCICMSTSENFSFRWNSACLITRRERRSASVRRAWKSEMGSCALPDIIPRHNNTGTTTTDYQRPVGAAGGRAGAGVGLLN